MMQELGYNFLMIKLKGGFMLTELFLVKPSKEYQESFREYVLAYKSINDEYYFNKYHKALENFTDFLTELESDSTIINPKYGVLTSTFWLINDKNVVGVVRVRHEEIGTAGHIGYDISPQYRKKGFGNYILKLALIEAAKIGITEAIVTCSIDNAYSRKIIENNGGNLLGTIYDPEDKEYFNKFKIVILP